MTNILFSHIHRDMSNEKSWFTKDDQQQCNQHLIVEGVEEYIAQKEEKKHISYTLINSTDYL